MPDNYPDIVSAINALPPPPEKSDIFVREGLWTLNLTWPYPQAPKQIIMKPCYTLRGEGIDRTIVEMQPVGVTPIRADVVTCLGDVYDFTLQDMTITQRAPAPDNWGSQLIMLRQGTSHRNIIFRRVRGLDAFGAGLGVPCFDGLTVEDCEFARVWTGITVLGGKNFYIGRNRLYDISGNGIFPQLRTIAPQQNVTDGIIEENYLENVGDIGVGIASVSGYPDHERITVRKNIFKNASIGCSGGVDMKFMENTVEIDRKLPIYCDRAQGIPINHLYEGNVVRTAFKVGMALYTLQNGTVRRNTVELLPPIDPAVPQSGMYLIIRQNSVIELNTVYNGDYSFDWAGWATGAAEMILKYNKLINFRKYGIYDNNRNQGALQILENQIYSDMPTAEWAIFTQNTTNRWLIQNNGVRVRDLIGDAAINAPTSTLIGNTAPTPPEEIKPFFPRLREVSSQFPRVAKIYEWVDEIIAKRQKERLFGRG